MTMIVTSLIPQLIKTYYRKEVEDISIFFPLLQLLAGCCMIPYALSIGSYQVFTIQCSVSTNSSILLYQIIKYRKSSIPDQNSESKNGIPDQNSESKNGIPDQNSGSKNGIPDQNSGSKNCITEFNLTN